MNIHQLIEDKTELAKTYAEDGAFHNAARVLEDLATHVSRHAVACDAAFAEAAKPGRPS